MTLASRTAAEAVSDEVAFNEAGLVPAIAQQHDTGEILMMAWMSRAALVETLTTGVVTYWSRSRGVLWRKGETSGHAQRLKEFRLDCDNDAVLLLVEQTGPACHTNRQSCFYRALRNDRLEEVLKPSA